MCAAMTDILTACLEDNTPSTKHQNKQKEPHKNTHTRMDQIGLHTMHTLVI